MVICQRSETQSWHQQNSKKNMTPFITAKVSQATVGVTEFLHHIWTDKEEKDKWITSKFSGFNCQIGLCHSMFYICVCVNSWILKDFYLNFKLKTPENMQRNRWKIVQVRVLEVLGVFLIFKGISPLWKVGLLYCWLLDEHIPFCLSRFHRKHTGC